MNDVVDSPFLELMGDFIHPQAVGGLRGKTIGGPFHAR